MCGSGPSRNASATVDNASAPAAETTKMRTGGSIAMRSSTMRVTLAGAMLAAAFAVTSTHPSADVQVTFDEWMTPSTPPYPHDPEVAPDGSVWYTGQRANVVGR